MLDQIDYFYSNRPCLGERVSGDIAIVEQQEQLLFIGIVDGLGHGKNANLVARTAKDYLQKTWDSDVCQTMLRLHDQLKGSLGAAVGLGVINLETKQLSYTGVGNTVFKILRRQEQKSYTKRLYSTDGIVGTQIRHPVEQQLQLTKSDIILFYTDGIREHFSLEEYPLIFVEDTMKIAKNLIQLFGKKYDDATCIALKYQP
ncbi:MAG: SpoIIE family protein phosphatase [Symploca sp. SIO2D2]|nr:SpoIIE family protein phosphatase [Symploca sp. SIO2D2]